MRKWVPQALVVPWPCLVNRGCGHHSVRPVCSSSQGQGAAMIQPSQLLSHVSHPWSCSSENFLLTSLPWVLTHVRALSQSSFSNSSSISRQLLLQDMAPMYLHCKGFFLMTPGRGSMSPLHSIPNAPCKTHQKHPICQLRRSGTGSVLPASSGVSKQPICLRESNGDFLNNRA